jgi:hypothetical protein
MAAKDDLKWLLGYLSNIESQIRLEQDWRGQWWAHNATGNGSVHKISKEDAKALIDALNVMKRKLV